MDFDRRNILTLPAALAAVGAVGSTAAAAVRGADQRAGMPDLADPQVNLDLLIRLLGSTDGRVKFNVGYGRAFAIFPDELAIPMYDAMAVQWVRFTQRADRSYDRQTGFVQLHDPIDRSDSQRWTNPVTGTTIAMPVTKSEFNAAHYTIYGIETPPEMAVASPEGRDKPRVYDWLILDDDVWLTKDDFSSYYSKRENRRLLENANRSYQTSAKAIVSGTPSLPKTMIEGTISRFTGWLDIPPERNGRVLWRFASKKYERFAELPRPAIDMLAKRAPEFLSKLSAMKD